MTSRDRFFNILHYRKTDRLPVLDFGYWPQLFDQWREQGHISESLYDGLRIEYSSRAKQELAHLLGSDFEYGDRVRADMAVSPPFEYEELDVAADGLITYVSHYGTINRKKEGAMGNHAVRSLLTDRKSYDELFKPRVRYFDGRVDLEFFGNWSKDDYNYPIGIHAGSLLGDIRLFLTLEGLSYLIADDFDLLVEIVDTYADMQYRCLEEIFSAGARFDYAHYWEDLCFNRGPLVGPKLFHDLTFEHYKKRNDLCRRYGIETISVDSDGRMDDLIPIWMESGIDVAFPIEVGTCESTIEDLRRQYGKRLRGIGGMDKRVLTMDKQSVDREIERLVPLVALGGYIPCPDHRLTANTQWDLVRYYNDRIRDLKL